LKDTDGILREDTGVCLIQGLKSFVFDGESIVLHLRYILRRAEKGTYAEEIQLENDKTVFVS